MPDETDQTTNEHVETPKEPTVEELRAQLTQHQQQLEVAQREAANARREAEGANAYMQNLLGTMRTAAEAGARGGGGNGATADERTLAERMAENPEGVLDEHFRARMGPIYNAYLANQDLQNKELAKERILRDDNLKDADGTSFWTKYESEIDQFMQGMPAEIRARPGAYERALKFVMAEHLDEVSEARANRMAKQREQRERGAFVEGPTGAAPRTRQPEGLTNLEKEIAKGLGMSEAQFLEAKKMDQFGHTGGT